MKKFWLVLLGVAAFAAGYTGVAHAQFPMYGRAEYDGYFKGITDLEGDSVWLSGIPTSVNTATEFINYTLAKLSAGPGTADGVGAAFIIQTMIGSARNNPPTAAQIADWKDRVHHAEDEGHIRWLQTVNYRLNSYYQGGLTGPNPDDDAFFLEPATRTDEVIQFINDDGSVAYELKYRCANPVGVAKPLSNNPQFTLTASSFVSDTTVIPGQTISYSHHVANSGPDTTTSTGWTVYSQYNAPALIVNSGFSNFTPGSHSVGTYSYKIPATAAPGQKYCQYLGVIKAVNGVGRINSVPACATVIAPTYTCGAVTPTPALPEVSEPFTFKVSVLYSYGPPTSPTTLSVQVAGLSPVVNGNYGYTTAGTVPGTLTSLAIGPETGAAPGTYQVNWTLIAPFGTKSCSAPITIVSKPYFKAYGADVSTGGGFDNGTGICTNPGQLAGFYDSSTNKGSAVQFAAQALGAIDQFASAGMRTSAPIPAVGLTFANSGASPPGSWGGNFGAVRCIPDYWATMPAGTTTVVNDNPNLTPILNPSVTQPNLINYQFKPATAGQPVRLFLPAGKVANGNKATIYVDGDAYIPRNIRLNDTGWATATDIPSIYVIARGNIYIDPTVTDLDGVYVAQPNGAVGGKIYTCADVGGKLTAAQIATQCQQQLRVYGAFIANSIKLDRSGNTMRMANPAEAALSGTNAACGLAACAGEVFNLGPESFLARPGFQPIGGSNSGTYDSITSLSPVL
jgi:hypothetical protein